MRQNIVLNYFFGDEIGRYGWQPQMQSAAGSITRDRLALRWLPNILSRSRCRGEVLHELGVTLSHVYVPTTAIVSLLYVMENDASAEIAVAGMLKARKS
jgi:hypothetical protein